MRLPQTGFGTSERRIRENPDEVLKMVRATLRGLMFTWEEKHRDEILDLIMRRLKISDRKLAAEIFRHLSSGLDKGCLGGAGWHPGPHRSRQRERSRQ